MDGCIIYKYIIRPPLLLHLSTLRTLLPLPTNTSSYFRAPSMTAQ